MNYEKTPSRQHEIKSFEKFDFKINFGIVTEFHRKYERTFRDQDGLRLTREDLEKMNDVVNQKLTIMWEATDEICETKYVDFAERIDPTVENGKPCRIEVWSTVEAPVLGTVLPADLIQGPYRQMIDPCAVIYDGKSRINLVPLFNVARIIRLREDAIKSIMPPSEILLALYPGFCLQNRQAQYQLKPKIALEVSPELTNSAAEYERH